MRIKAQVAMVMNLDKCIGCHTCSVTCKNTWTNRPGLEYAWFNNVETKPGQGYPRRWEDARSSRSGFALRGGRLTLRSGSPLARLFHIFFNPDLPEIDAYGDPTTYDYARLTGAPLSRHQPVARPRRLLTGEPSDGPVFGPNWEDDLAGSPQALAGDPDRAGLEERITLAFEEAFFFYLPRICEHCLNPACVAACPSGAMYKRDEDGIVLVDHDACRGWRFCVSACPYKKVYFNGKTHKAEKCHFCYPRLEAGLPTVCSATCVGRIRYLGVVLYDADGVRSAASRAAPEELYPAQLALFLDATDPEVTQTALRQGIPPDWLEAARRSPVFRLIKEFAVALPLHPEYRTLPMVWYVPPLSPVLPALGEDGDPADAFAAVERLRIPIRYLANLLAAGDEEVVRGVLRRLVAMRLYERAKLLGLPADEQALERVGLSAASADALAQLLGLARYEERFVLPTASSPDATPAGQGQAGFDRLADRCPVEEVRP